MMKVKLISNIIFIVVITLLTMNVNKQIQLDIDKQKAKEYRVEMMYKLSGNFKI